MVARKVKNQRGNLHPNVKHDLDIRQVKELAKIQCTLKEIAAVMGALLIRWKDTMPTLLARAERAEKHP